MIDTGSVKPINAIKEATYMAKKSDRIHTHFEEWMGRRLAEERQRAGMTQADVADEIGVSDTTIWRIETCSGSVGTRRLFTYAKIIEVLRFRGSQINLSDEVTSFEFSLEPPTPEEEVVQGQTDRVKELQRQIDQLRSDNRAILDLLAKNESKQLEI